MAFNIPPRVPIDEVFAQLKARWEAGQPGRDTETAKRQAAADELAAALPALSAETVEVLTGMRPTGHDEEDDHGHGSG